jgi:hypothetical protein
VERGGNVGVGTTLPTADPVASVSTATAGRSRGYMMGWTEADGDALFRQPSEEPVADDGASVSDGSREAMRRLRFPFEADPADVAEQGRDVPLDDDEYRG